MRLPMIALFFGLLCANAHAAPNVLVSIKPLHSIVAAVMDGAGAPELLLTGVASPHSYALKPSDARKIARAEVIFWTGPVLETFLETPLANLCRGARIVALGDAKGVMRLPARIKGAGAICVFSTPQFSPRLLPALTEGSAARSAVLDDLGADIPEGPGLYEALLVRIAGSLRSCLVP